jgi:two-component system LytT family response regulator
MGNSKKLRTLLIDDERHCIETLRYELERHCPDIEVVGTASSGAEGIRAISEYEPDLIFLDIEMPGMNGFEMLKQIEPVDFSVIFATAYDQYAIQAFRCAATDYLLKPVMSDVLKEAVSRVTSRPETESYHKEQLEVLLHNMREGMKSLRLALPSGRSMDFVDASEIIYCNADSNYTHIILSEGRKYTLSKTLKDVEQMLAPLDFFRVHQSFLINFNYMRKYLRDDGGYVVMSDGKTIPIAKRRKEEFLAKMRVN